MLKCKNKIGIENKIYLVNVGKAAEYSKHSHIADVIYEKIVLVASSYDQATEQIRDFFTQQNPDTERKRWFITKSHEIEIQRLKWSLKQVIEILETAGYSSLQENYTPEAATKTPMWNAAFSRLSER